MFVGVFKFAQSGEESDEVGHALSLAYRGTQHVNYGLVVVSFRVGHLRYLLLDEAQLLHILRTLSILGHPTHAVLNLLHTKQTR